ncbi:hypothetical protein BDR26DRAFT_485649 [Obelidium mucronatum]|nr:hypothetical protein BDR26DRAFT_485649 [Obelidium mucronatum]
MFPSLRICAETRGSRRPESTRRSAAAARRGRRRRTGGVSLSLLASMFSMSPKSPQLRAAGGARAQRRSRRRRPRRRRPAARAQRRRASRRRAAAPRAQAPPAGRVQRPRAAAARRCSRARTPPGDHRLRLPDAAARVSRVERLFECTRCSHLDSFFFIYLSKKVMTVASPSPSRSGSFNHGNYTSSFQPSPIRLSTGQSTTVLAISDEVDRKTAAALGLADHASADRYVQTVQTKTVGKVISLSQVAPSRDSWPPAIPLFSIIESL